MKDWWNQFDLAEKFFIELSLLAIKFAAIASLAGCGVAAAMPSGGRMAKATLAVIEADIEMERPKLPDTLDRSSDAGAVAVAPAPFVTAKPQVQLFTTDGCPPCVEAKKALVALKIPHFVMPKPNPAWAEKGGYPATAWKVGETWHYQFGFVDAASFKAHYESTFRLKVQAASVTPAKTDNRLTYRSSGPHWTWPGDVGEHLVSNHGYSWAQVRSMSQAQRIAAHDAAHNGYAVVPKRRRTRMVASVCPGGRCP